MGWFLYIYLACGCLWSIFLARNFDPQVEIYCTHRTDISLRRLQEPRDSARGIILWPRVKLIRSPQTVNDVNDRYFDNRLYHKYLAWRWAFCDPTCLLFAGPTWQWNTAIVTTIIILQFTCGILNYENQVVFIDGILYTSVYPFIIKRVQLMEKLPIEFEHFPY